MYEVKVTTSRMDSILGRAKCRTINNLEVILPGSSVNGIFSRAHVLVSTVLDLSKALHGIDETYHVSHRHSTRIKRSWDPV
jgi:hypothetical protein